MTDATQPQGSSSALKPLLIGLGVIVALAAVYFLVVSPLLLSGGDDLSGPETPSPSQPDPEAVPTPEPTEEEFAPGDPVPETFEIFSARDPFHQLVVESTGGGGTTPGPAPTTPPGQVTVGGTTITNVDVYTDNGQNRVLVTVNGTGYDVGVGDTFANGTMQVLDITPPCATFMFGSSRFTLCEGESIRK